MCEPRGKHAPCELWYVYLLRCSDLSLYTGIAKNMQRRLFEHRYDRRRGAKYTRAKGVLRIEYYECCHSRSAACKREAAIKRMSKRSKERLANSQVSAQRHSG